MRLFYNKTKACEMVVGRKFRLEKNKAELRFKNAMLKRGHDKISSLLVSTQPPHPWALFRFSGFNFFSTPEA
jgi:hypothetical protein